MNPIKTTFLLTCPTLLLVAMGSAVDGQAGMFVALAVACVFFQSVQTKSSSRHTKPGKSRNRGILPFVGCPVALPIR